MYFRLPSTAPPHPYLDTLFQIGMTSERNRPLFMWNVLYREVVGSEYSSPDIRTVGLRMNSSIWSTVEEPINTSRVWWSLSLSAKGDRACIFSWLKYMDTNQSIFKPIAKSIPGVKWIYILYSNDEYLKNTFISYQRNIKEHTCKKNKHIKFLSTSWN